MKPMWVYIMTDKPYGTLYTGFTSQLVKRVYQHKTDAFPDSFTAWIRRGVGKKTG